MIRVWFSKISSRDFRGLLGSHGFLEVLEFACSVLKGMVSKSYLVVLKVSKFSMVLVVSSVKNEPPPF